MRRLIKQKVRTVIVGLELNNYIVVATGVATFFFGFAAKSVATVNTPTSMPI